MEKRKKIIKTIGLIIICMIIAFLAFNITGYVTTGNNRINVKTNATYYADSKIEAVISVEDKISKPIKSKLSVQLYDSDGKKVKNVKQKYDLEKGESADVSLEIPANIDSGNYKLEVISKSGLKKDVAQVPIQIIKDVQSTINISLDKGIYKPGDQVNFRALIVSKKDFSPVSKNEVTVDIYDGNDNRVYSENATTSEYGIVSGTFNLANEVNSGTYKLVVSTESNETTKVFNVNPYITPKFETVITTDKENYLIGEDVQITVDSKYFFGEPVTGASVVGTINGSEIKGLTDKNGIYTTVYKTKEVGNIQIDFSITDSSNYMIESSKAVVCGTDLFEIELLPEYGSVMKNVDNDIYIFTKTAAGKGVKTYSQISIGNISKQVISDGNGIGVFTLTASELDNLSSSKSNYDISITSEDENTNIVKKTESVEFSTNKGTLIKTDKVKYEVGESIKVSLNSNIDRVNNTIYVFKNNELLNSITFDGNETEIELEDTYGIIDIFVPNDSTQVIYKNNNSRLSNYSKRTIFIKPNNNLNIAINTDAEEYKPGDTLNIEFNTTNENNNSVDSALLVSILDEAILNLAENDLSIDNIKLALEDIKLIEGMTAADLYANVLDESSDIELRAVMLKQSQTDPRIINKTYSSGDRKDEFIERIVYALILLIVIIVVKVIIDNRKKIKNISNMMIHFLNWLGICLLWSLYCTEICVELLDAIVYGMGDIVFLVNIIISAVLYALVLYKEKDLIWNAVKLFGAIPMTFLALYLIYGFTYYEFDFELPFVYIIIAAVVFLFISFTANVKNKKLAEQAKCIMQSLLKSVGIWILTLFIGGIFEEFSILIVLIGYIISQKVVLETDKPLTKEGKIVLKITPMELCGIFVGILLILVFFAYLRNEAQSSIRDSMSSMPNSSTTLGTMDIESFRDKEGIGEVGIETRPSTSFADINISSITESAQDTTSASGSINSFDFSIPFFSNFAGNIEDSMQSMDSINTDAYEKFEEFDNQLPENELVQEADSKVEENVRNVFLESLAFVPELITENGKANYSTKISDNITTWSIQTVGNTKEGNIGYASSNFKVFKEFFVDFSLPTNSVVTDKTNIPVTVYNYTEGNLTININIKENEWSNIGEYPKTIEVAPNATNMIYVPIEIIKSGNNVLRVEAEADNVKDIVEKTFEVKENGMEIQEIALSGSIEKDYSGDILFNEQAIEGTEKLKVKLYSSPMVQIIEGMESMLSLPTGCFEQTSSSLYPDVLILKYLKENELDNEEIREKALRYIEVGYQKLLTYEVKGVDGGYSLYGHNPAEPVITAFGLMEMNEMSEVYSVDPKVIEEMKDYLFDVQNVSGKFDYKSTYIGGASNTSEEAMNSYIIWALSEVCPDDKRLEKSINYIDKIVEETTDNYTLALAANIYANIGEKAKSKDVIKELMSDIKESEKGAYLPSYVRDYYGSSGKYQNIQTTALASMALSKLNENTKNNTAFIDYLISAKNSYGNWGTTQATVLALKAINDFSKDSDISNQTVTVELNGQKQTIEINENSLDFYELEFDNVAKENKFTIELEKGKINYEIIKEYYKAYEDIEETEVIKVEQELNTSLKVNEEITQKVTIRSNATSNIENGLLKLSIPQGTTVIEESLLQLQYSGIIEKYEYNYGNINLYISDIEPKEEFSIEIKYRALYPEEITGASVRFYDYYNPEVEGFAKPIEIKVSK